MDQLERTTRLTFAACAVLATMAVWVMASACVISAWATTAVQRDAARTMAEIRERLHEAIRRYGGVVENSERP